MNKLDDILHSLAMQQPELSDADALCDSIMRSLPDRHPVIPWYYSTARTISSVAAMFLLALFLHQFSDVLMTADNSPHKEITLSSPIHSLKTENEIREYAHKVANTNRFSNYIQNESWKRKQ